MPLDKGEWLCVFIVVAAVAYFIGAMASWTP